LLQAFTTFGGRRQRTPSPLVITRSGHAEPRAHVHNGVTGLLRIDELILDSHRCSRAKKAAAFFKNSFSSRSLRFSRSSASSRSLFFSPGSRAGAGSSPRVRR